jgi:hypothetical protein
MPSSLKCLRVYLHLLPLLHCYNNHLHIVIQPSIERGMFLLRKDKILVPLRLLLLPRGRTITRMWLIRIRTTCNHQHHHQVVHMPTIATVGLHHPLRYEIMTIS